ncbi:putative HTH-type transcriptional regulator YdfH [Planctomycetes bacterium CA13]|uniref:Putative HTH-type transcriptional regulator YdfH n=1 Tax=Novipirellula herctigrandis TaxID=2527986 RepID=A0A5C5Z1A1_9BACT|nr:putative HTH-type transcriptional regulator YdfH [Planctomycetes bacterium CA13]
MNLRPITVREQVTNRIRDELVSGRFPAGTMLRETELASRLGVSRGPVRDAFIQLSNEGYLAYQANRGVTVRHPPQPEDRAFVTSIRVQIESHIIEEGIEDLTDEGIATVESALARMEAACETGVSTTIALHDIAFHEAILVACGGGDFVPAWRQLVARMMLTYTRLGDYDQMYEEHARIFADLREKNKEATIASIKANIK